MLHRIIRSMISVLILLAFSASDIIFAQQIAPAPMPPMHTTSLADEQPVNNGNKNDEEAKELDEYLQKDVRELSQVQVRVPAMDTPVTSVMRTESTVGRSPTAIFVVTQEMIRRSGANYVPEVLRMVPGIEVARINASQWSVTCRGFSGRFANKLLVQIDGRSIYTSAFSGVYWEANLVMLQDVERIEVIRGPGASVWGSNAVNGVINIITKSSKDTQGLLFYGGSGNEQLGLTNLRYGGQVGNDLTWRVYGMWQDQSQGLLPMGNGYDDWRSAQGGFRADWEPNQTDTVTLQGDVYNGYAGGEYLERYPVLPYIQNVDGDAHMSGGNVLARWRRDFEDGDGWAVQFFYDRLERSLPLIAGFIDTIDIDFQCQVSWGERHQIVWGAEYRHYNDKFQNTFTTELIPPARGTNIYSWFIQDQYTVVDDRLFFTLGSKFEYNDYSQFECQPTARILYSPDSRRAIWGAVSRAVRTPSRIEADVAYHVAPVFYGPPEPTWITVAGNHSIKAEDLLAWEMGYRAQPTDNFSWDVTLFYNQYYDLIYSQPISPTPTPTAWYWPFDNVMHGETYGYEVSATWQIRPRWKTTVAYSYLQMYLHLDEGVSSNGETEEGWSPNNQVYFQSSWDLKHDVDFDLMLRYVDNLRTLNVPAYVTMDFRLAWRPTKHFEAAVVGRNLLDGRHLEYVANQGPEALQTEVERAFFGTVTWQH